MHKFDLKNGVPVGSTEYIKEFVGDTVTKHHARFDHIVQLGHASHTQEALMLLWQCARPRTVFPFQCTPYHIAPQAFDDSHRDLIDAFARIIGASA